LDTSRGRILQFIESQGISPKIFLEKTGLKKGFIDRSHVNSSASDIYLSKILEVFPELSAYWLLTGRGSMLRSNKNLKSINQSITENGNNSNIIDDSDHVNVDSGNTKTQKHSTKTIDNSLLTQLSEKDKQISTLLEQQSKFLEQIDKLVEQQSKLISKL